MRQVTNLLPANAIKNLCLATFFTFFFSPLNFIPEHFSQYFAPQSIFASTLVFENPLPTNENLYTQNNSHLKTSNEKGAIAVSVSSSTPNNITDSTLPKAIVFQNHLFGQSVQISYLSPAKALNSKLHWHFQLGTKLSFYSRDEILQDSAGSIFADQQNLYWVSAPLELQLNQKITHTSSLVATAGLGGVLTHSSKSILQNARFSIGFQAQLSTGVYYRFSPRNTLITNIQFTQSHALSTKVFNAGLQLGLQRSL